MTLERFCAFFGETSGAFGWWLVMYPVHHRSAEELLPKDFWGAT